MGIINFAEEAAGAFAADKALEAVDPNAGFLAKAAAAVAVRIQRRTSSFRRCRHKRRYRFRQRR
jgi:hypothetical protein